MVYGILCVVFFLVEIFIALFLHDGLIRPYVGDVLVVILLCCLVRMIIPEGTQFLSLYVFLFASAVEVGQYFDYASFLGLSDVHLFRVILGNTFSVADLVCYAVGSGLFFAAENLTLSYIEKKKRDKN
ncbi:MAG: DUF2809 domain-containing protein [Clostridia bacterium]|nr:DUF2809 domain-containing protein [Clostridia bacterium]